jgi:NodT family efflux transporter outer membrane factor (OMF) lipoprotein
MIKKGRTFFTAIALIVLLGSCGVVGPHRKPDITVSEKLYRELPATDTSNFSNLPWRNLFTDPYLQELIEEAIANNSDLQIALTRMDKAKANLRQSQLALLPSLNANGSAAFQNKENDGTGTVGGYQLYGSSSWELDLWGKLRSMKRANLASFLQSESYKRMVQTRLIANVAETYYTLLAYDEQLKITEKTLKARIANLETMGVMKENDVITGADLMLSEASRYAAEVTIPDLKQNIYRTENALSILLGRTPGSIERGILADQDLNPNLTYGIPAQLLANRPDIQQAEHQLRYTFEMTNVARAYFYPSITLTASGGISETDITRLFNANFIFWNILGGLTQPLFNQGINNQRLRVARANEQEDLIAFKQTLLAAGSEVVNAMNSYQASTEKIALRAKQVESLEKAVDYTMELLKYTSNINYTDVLTSEVNLLNAQLSSTNDKLSQLNAVVTLYETLGGGWK